MRTDRVGMIGLGNMGGRMARRLIAAGVRVMGLDTQPERVSAAGALLATGVHELADFADVLMLSLPDSAEIEAVTDGPAGLMAQCRTGQIVIDLSTAAPASTVRLAGRYAQRGVPYLDAGISGGAAAAERGTLTLMVGGDFSALQTVRWALAPISAKVVHLGVSGAGHTTKLLNNFLNAVSLAASAEVMVAAKKAGLDLARVLEVINASSGVNFATLNRFPHIINGDYLEGGLTGRLMTKDIVLYIEHVRELGVSSLNAAGPLACFGLGSALGYGDQISNRVVDAIGDVSGGVRLHDPSDSTGAAT